PRLGGPRRARRGGGPVRVGGGVRDALPRTPCRRPGMIAPLRAGWRDGAVGPVRVDGRHLLWGGGTRAAVVRSSDFDLTALAAAGAGAEVLEGEALAARVHDAWGGGAVGAGAQRFGRPAWQARPREASTGAVWVRGYRLRRLPGCAVEPGWLAPLLLTRAEC